MGRTAPVTVDLDRNDARQGEQGEGDTIRRVQDVTGGAGADQLSGDGLANDLRGLEGDDGISGEAGPDLLSGGPGQDVITPSPQVPFQFAVQPDGAVDRIFCGEDHDLAWRVPADGDQTDACETVLGG